MPNNSEFEKWLEQEIPTIPQDQIDKFSDFDSIHAAITGEFSPSDLAEKLSQKVGSKVIGIDSGGGSIRGGVYRIEPDGSLATTSEYSEKTEAENGEGFLSLLERYAAYARENNLPVGISYGGPLEGSRPIYHPKIPELMDELGKKYKGDFANIFTTPLSVLNDGPAGLIRGVDMVYRSGIENPIVFYLINGGGLGLAVYKDGVLYSTEAGHVECAPGLNAENADRPCGIYGNYVCLENVISNKQGMERQWLAKTGNFLTGKEIEDKFRDKDPLAQALFEQVATAQAAMIQGVANVFDVEIDDPRFSIVVHGGMERTPNIRKRTAQILWQNKSPYKNILFTEEFDPNACMYGAALMAESI